MKPSDDDLNSLLKVWTVPESPSSLEERMRRAYRSRPREKVWPWLLHGSLRIPVPVFALCLAALLLLLVATWRRSETLPHQQHVVQEATSGGYHFVTVLKPRIIRRNHVNEN